MKRRAGGVSVRGLSVRGLSVRWSAIDGQASVELVGTAWALLLSALVGFQLLAAGYGWAMAGHAAEAAALAVVNSRDPAAAARRALPGWPGSAIELQRDRGRVAVTVVPPSLLRPLRRRLAITAEAEVREPAAGARGPL
jgi:hypothetical protein